MIREKRRTPPGASPGTLSIDPLAPRPVISLIAYGPMEFTEQAIDDPQKIRDFLGRWPVVWINVDGLGNAEALSQIGTIFSLHRLALEDVVNVHQRAKVDEYADHLFIVARMVEKSAESGTEQLSIFLGANYVLTFQERAGDCFDPLRDRIRRSRGRVREAGADYLAYCILDGAIDDYFPTLEQYGERLEGLEDDIIAHPGRSCIARIHAIKRELLILRRAIWPLREAVNVLYREHTTIITEPTRLYLRDCYDHTIQVIDLLENHREIASDLMDVYLSSVSNRMNEVMKVLTVITTIFIPLTFIAGIYGMNFDPDSSPWNMPELRWRWGYPACMLIMAAIAAGLLISFRRRGWLGSVEDDPPTDPPAGPSVR